MHCMLSAVTCATAHSPRPLDAAPGRSPSERDAKRKRALVLPSAICLFWTRNFCIARVRLMSARSMMIQNRHEIYSMCRHLQCTSCIAAIAFVLSSVEFTL